MRRLVSVLLWALVLLWLRAAAAHDVVPGSLSLVELERGRFSVRWTAPATPAGKAEIDPEFPPECQLLDRVIACEHGLSGTLAFAGLAGSVHRVVVRVTWLGGQEQSLVVSGERPEIELRGAFGGETAGTFREFGRLGVEHILTGFDHLCFVVGLVLLVRRGRALVATVTAFTLAHSVTLAASVLGWVRIASAPVEAVIALSIVLLAVECASPRESWAKRAPWVVALAFGLLHGFGFAGALSEIGLPPHQISLALLAFNLGVEAGQLAVVLPLWWLLRFAGGSAAFVRAERLVVYALGGVGVFWALERVSGMLG